MIETTTHGITLFTHPLTPSYIPKNTAPPVAIAKVLGIAPLNKAFRPSSLNIRIRRVGMVDAEGAGGREAVVEEVGREVPCCWFERQSMRDERTMPEGKDITA